ncbi:minor tail protein [Lacticaseibacillus sharpeae JCM 1186 = DSM 20505]|uniref:Minor tail protein n=2 Tax=Lacticaseibacillus sharpeae TaxID=1626 RepID=A0A0R1ZI58_9LACO|nr:minor tail protein [Lacticaseibacillus sharpeae JCM 1186 = DSM 20505]
MSLTDKVSPVMNKMAASVSKAEGNFDKLKTSANGIKVGSAGAVSAELNKSASAAEKATGSMKGFSRSISFKDQPVGNAISESLTKTHKEANRATDSMDDFNKAAGTSPKMGTDSLNESLRKSAQASGQARDEFGRFIKTAETSGGFPLGTTVENGLTSIDSHLTKTNGMFRSMLGAQLIGNGISAGIGMIRDSLSGLYGDLSEASATWQTFQGNMSNIGMPQAQINSTKKELQKFAQQTIYSASDMASTYSQLAAVGTKNTTQLVKGFGGLAAASAEPTQAMTTLSQQATQMAAKPKVQWEDFKLILEQTPAGVAAVAKTMGVSTTQMIKNVQDGKLATQDFFDAIAKTGTNANFTAMATKFKTIGQAADGLKETITNKLQSAFDSTSKVGINFLSGLSDKIADFDLDGLLAKFAAFGKGLKQTMAMPEVNLAMGNMKRAIMNVVTALTGIKPGQSGLQTMADLGEAAGDGIAKAADAVSGFANWVSALDPQTIQDTAKGALALFAALKGYSVISSIFANLKSGMLIALATGVARFVGSWSPGELKAAGAALAIVVVALKGLQTASKISSSVQNLVKMFALIGPASAPAAAGETAVGKAAGMSAGSMLKFAGAALMIGGAIVLAAAGMWILVQAATQLAAGGWPAVGALVALAAAIAAMIAVTVILGPALTAGSVGLILFGVGLALVATSVLIAAAGMALLATALPTVAQYGLQAAVAFVALAPALVLFGAGALVAGAGAIVLGAGLLVFGAAVLVATVGVTALAVGMMLLGAATLLVGTGMTLLAITLPLIAATVLTVTAGFGMMSLSLLTLAPTSLMAAAAVAALGAGLMVLGAGALVAAAGAVVLGAGLMVVSAGVLAVAAAVAVASVALAGLGVAVMALATAFVGAGSMLVTAITSAMSRVISAVRTGISNAVSAAKTFGSSLVSVGKDLISGLIKGVTGMAKSAVKAVGGVVSGIVGKAKSLLHIGSPSKLFKKFGRWTLEGYTIGVNERAGSSTDAMASAMNGVVDAGSGMTMTGPTVTSTNPAAMVAGDVAAMQAATDTSLQVNAPSVKGHNPGDILAAGFQRAADAVGSITNALTALPAMSNVDIVGRGQNMAPQTVATGTVGDIDTSGTGGDFYGLTGGPGDGDTPSQVASGVSGGNSYTRTSTATHTDNSIHVDKGAIVVNGGNPDDAETIVAKLETYLKQRQEAQL